METIRKRIIKRAGGTARLVLIASLILLASCDDYLDIEPKGRALLKTTADYEGLIEDLSPTYDHTTSWFLAGDATWYRVEEIRNYTYPDYSVSVLWDESYDRAANSIDNNLYNSCYSRITNCNAIIDNVMDSDGKEADKLLAMAQARIMRAYNYFFLVNTFARPYDPATAGQTNGVIVRDHMFESIEEEGVQRSVAEVYDFIQSDIDAAIDDLPHVAKNSFRPDRTFGLALKAKVHLFKREIDACMQACQEALAEAPNGNHQLWNMTEDYQRYAPMLLAMGYPEQAIDEPQYMGMNDLIEAVWKNRVTYGFDGAEHLLYQFCATYTDPFPMYLTREVLDLFERDADLRYRFLIRYKAQHETAPAGAQDFASLAVKWNPAGIRLSEVYLMMAECQARQGHAESAMALLELLRSHRMVPGRYVHLTATTADEALRLVRQERRRELFLTYNSFFDMRRFCSEFNETLTREFEGQTLTLSPTSHLLTFPFPLKAMQNSHLTQNSR